MLLCPKLLYNYKKYTPVTKLVDAGNPEYVFIIPLLVVFVKRHKTEKLGVEVKFDLADGAVAVLGYKKLGNISRFVIVVILLVIIRAVEEHDEVGVLLDRAGLAEVGENGAGIVTAGDRTRELGEGNDGDV